MHPKYLQISNFAYNLPDERIAKFPLPERDQSKLLVYKNGTIGNTIYKNIAEQLPAKSLLIFNDTRVVAARLLFQKTTGALIEVFCLEPGFEYPDITTAMLQKSKVRWKCLVGGANKWKHGMVLEKKLGFDANSIKLRASVTEQLSDSFIIELSWQPEHLTFSEVLQKAGQIPLPPYLHRDVIDSDKERYQTIYANQNCSVAAPTAGLHFTKHIFEELAKKNINRSFVTLHVGAGTFKPVKAAMIADHEMHAEFIDVSFEAIQQVAEHLQETIVAVGTTSTRTLESLYWMGVKIYNTSLREQDSIRMEELAIEQWEPYELTAALSPKQSLKVLMSWMEQKNFNRLITRTRIMIAPGYRFKIVNALVTNFHQPQSTLLLLIAAMVGDDWKRIYEFALQNDFRFLSYGDGCLLQANSPA